VSSQLGAALLRQRPLTQVSVPSQALPLLHCALVVHAWQPVTGVCTQPVCELHASSVQALPSPQDNGVPLWQRPFTHASVPLHGFPSLHVPLVVQASQSESSVCVQPVCAWQPSVVHGLLSLQLRAPLDWQMPLRHVSVPLHTLPSAHEVPSLAGWWVQTPALQRSVVHGFWSSHSAPEPHTPSSFDSVLSTPVLTADTAKR
jgi:hypothetical protein